MSYRRDELSAALTDVRRAYRLLWAYQRRMDDLTNTFARHLGFVDYWFEPDDKEGWARLPMVSYGRAYLRYSSGEYPRREYWNYPKPGDLMLNFWIESDSEHRRLGEQSSWKREPNPIEFRDAAESKSLVHVDIFANLIDRQEITNWRDGILRPTYYLEHEDNRLVDHAKVPGIKIFTQTFDLVDLGDGDAIVDAADRLRKALVAAGGTWPSDDNEPSP